MEKKAFGRQTETDLSPPENQLKRQRLFRLCLKTPWHDIFNIIVFFMDNLKTNVLPIILSILFFVSRSLSLKIRSPKLIILGNCQSPVAMSLPDWLTGGHDVLIYWITDVCTPLHERVTTVLLSSSSSVLPPWQNLTNPPLNEMNNKTALLLLPMMSNSGSNQLLFCSWWYNKITKNNTIQKDSLCVWRGYRG